MPDERKDSESTLIKTIFIYAASSLGSMTSQTLFSFIRAGINKIEDYSKQTSPKQAVTSVSQFKSVTDDPALLKYELFIEQRINSKKT